MTPPPVDPSFIKPGVPTPIRIMNEYSADFPVWGPDGGYSADRSAEYWPEFDAELIIALRQFAALFNSSYDWQTGTWPAGFDTEAYFRTGEALRERVAEALGDGYAVTFHRWESERTR